MNSLIDSICYFAQAYFLRAIHITPGRFKTLYIITNNWHMPRTKSIFTKVFSLPEHTILTSDNNIDNIFSWFFLNSNTVAPPPITLKFEEVSAGIDDKDTLAARLSREVQSLESFNTNVAPLWNTFQELHLWLYKQHDAYRAQRLINTKNNSKLTEDILKSY